MVSAIGASSASFLQRTPASSLSDRRLDAGVDELIAKVFGPRSRREHGGGEAAQLTDDARLDPLGLDRDRRRQDSCGAEPSAEQLDVVESVEEWDDDRIVRGTLWHAFERLGKLSAPWS